MKTAYIELNTTNQINSLVTTQGNNVFSYKGIDFFPNASVTSLIEILNLNYQYYILDIGVLSTYNLKEFLRCDKQFLVCSSRKWKLQNAKEKIDSIFKNKKALKFVTMIMNLSEKEIHYSIFSNLHNCVSFPFIENPFQLTIGHVHVMAQILERNLYIGTY